MEAPPPKYISNIKLLKALKNNEHIQFQILTKENNFVISTKIENLITQKIYEGIFSLREIQKNKYFLQFDSIQEIFEELVFKSQTEYPTITEENDSLILKIFLSSSKFKDIEFTLKPKIKSNEDKFKELYTILSELKNENFELKEEVDNLKKENFKFKEQLNILIKSKSNSKNKKINGKESNQNNVDDNNEEEYIKSHLNIIYDNEDDEDDEEKSLKSNKVISSNYKLESLNTSLILNNSEKEIKKFKNFLFPDISFDSELKYRLTRDGKSFKIFHKLCDNIAPNLLLIKDDKDNIFGGFTNVSWEDMDIKKKDSESFLFSVTKNKKYYPKSKYGNHILCIENFGPKFCSENLCFPFLNMSICISTKRGEYLDESLSTNKPGQYFIVKEVELYQILFN